MFTYLVFLVQTLISNGLRERVILRVDGGFKSGFDVLMAAVMGADEYGFGSVAMIATGCVMARICHTNNCPVGVASQVVIICLLFSQLICLCFSSI
jgi:glutamate synthase (ferredoxin)